MMQEESMPKIVVKPRLRSVGANFRDAFVLLYKQWAPLLIIQAINMFASFLVVGVALMLFMAPVFWTFFRGYSEQDIFSFLFSGYFISGLVLISLPAIFISAWGASAMIYVLKYRYDQMAPIGESLKKGFVFVVPIFFLILLSSAAMYGAFLLFIVPAFVLAAGLSIAVYIRILEGTSIFQAMATSWRVTKGYKWSIFGRIILVALTVWIVAFILGVGSMVPIMGIFSTLGSLILNLVITPYLLAFLYCIYEDIREVRKDVYPLRGGISLFMVVCWILSALFCGGLFVVWTFFSRDILNYYM